MALATVRAWQRAWLADDAFISLRYARNLVDGHGLVYNAGEYVEGYTNLLWTLILAAGMASGLSGELVAKVMGIVAWLALIAVLAWRAGMHARRTDTTVLPLAAGIITVMPASQLWASGGLETSLFAFLVTAGLIHLATDEPSQRRLMLAGVLLALATLTRPDGALFAAVGVGATAYGDADSWRERGRRVAALVTPLVLVGGVLLAFKLTYYGAWLPTAFYAKSAADPYYSQGLYYIGLFLADNWILPAATLLLLLGLRGRFVHTLGVDCRVFGAAFALYLVYVAHSGGDFMHGRRIMMTLPLFALVLERLVNALDRRAAYAVSLFILTGAALPLDPFDGQALRLHGVAEEYAFYPPTTLARRAAEGNLAHDVFGATPLRAMYSGGMCMFGYYSRLPYLAEMTGLTQYSLAQTPLVRRGMVGHEKAASEDWLHDNGIDLVFLRDTVPLESDGRRDPRILRIGPTLSARVVRYRDEVMNALEGHNEVDYVPIADVIEAAERALPALGRDDARALLEWLDAWYFDHARDATVVRTRLHDLAARAPNGNDAPMRCAADGHDAGCT
ncbi:MAG: hypothetical protein AB7Q81_24240 [Gammaproteobacteria bacterium]